MNRTRKAGPCWPSKSNGPYSRMQRDEVYRRLSLLYAFIPLAEKNQ